MKKFRLSLLVCIMALLCAPSSVQAKTGAAQKGASFPKYKKTVEIKIDKNEKDLWRAVSDAMATAKKKASSSTRYKVTIPNGTYKVKYTIGLESNVWISAGKKTVVQMETGAGRIFSTDYDGKSRQNIKITGGVWDASVQSPNDKKARDSMFVRLAHIKNLQISDAVFKVKRRNHILEFSDINGLTISGCTISGNNYDKSASYHVQPKEAIQLDVATKAAMPKYTPYNGKGCHNVIIQNNTLKNVARGIGSHSETKGAEKNPYTNITVKNNKITNALGEGIFVLRWKNCTIQGNQITNCKRAGVYLEDCSYDKIYKNVIKKIGAYSGKRAKTYGKDYAAVMLTIVKNTEVTKNRFLQKKGSLVLDRGRCSKNKMTPNSRK